MVDRSSASMGFASMADLDDVLDAAHQRRAQAMGRFFTVTAALAGLPAQVCRMMVQAWLRRLERRIQSAVGRLDRAGLLEGRPRGRRPY